MPLPSPPGLYDPADPAQLRQQVYDQVLAAASTLPARSNNRFTLSLVEPRYADAGEFTPAEEKRALLSNRGLSRKLVGTWQLTDNATGQVVDKRQKTIARVPYVTPRGTIVHDGVDYVTVAQSRLKPGVYTRLQANGEVEAHANILPGEGVSHRYFLNPAKNTFRMRVAQAEIPLLPLLRAYGATDAELREAWGDEILSANRKVNEQMVLQKYYDRIIGSRGRPGEDQTQAVLTALARMRLDPEISRRTLGSPFDKIDKDTILAVTKKILDVSRGQAEPDSRDNLENRRFLHLPELLAERLNKDYGKHQRQLLRRATFKGNLDVIPPGALTPQLASLILHSGLGQAAEEVNPLEILDKLTKVTSLGEGGIGSTDAIPAESREVNSTQYGFQDPVRTPENMRSGIDVYFAQGARKGADGRLYAPFTNTRTGQVEYKAPEDLVGKTLTFPGELSRQTKRVRGIKDGRLDFYPRQQVSYVLPHFEGAFSPLGNLIPGKSASKAHRMAMGSRMITQALPLLKGEAPLVQAADPDSDGSFEERLGERMGAVRAKLGGQVLLSGNDQLKVRYDDGREETLPLYTHTPLNRKTFLHQTPLVKPGDRFAAGQTLVKSNFTDDAGRAAVGVNARVGYMAYPGNFEDAIVVSEDFAKRTTSQHAYQHVKEFSPEHKRGRAVFAGIFPTKYTRQQLSQFDDEGVIKPGSIVEKDMPLVLAVRQKELTRSQIHKGRQSNFVDDSELWEHDSPGLVTDVHKEDDGSVTVVVSSEEISKEADKYSGRFGDKGVSAVVVPNHKMPQGEDGKPLDILLNPLGLISRVNATQIIEAVLGKVAAKTGKPYKLRDFDDLSDMAQFAYREMKRHGVKDLETVYDPGSNRSIPGVLVGNRFFMKLHHTSESKLQSRETGSYTAEGQPSKGAGGKAKRLALLASNALLASGAYETLRDASLIRGQRNEDFWGAFLQGVPPPTPQVPMVYQKLVNSLKASGINVVEDGPSMHLMALTNQDVDALAGEREVKTGDTVRFDKGLEPVPGGLFDPQVFGGHNASRWGMIKLDEPLPNPAFEDPIRRLLGLTKNRFQAVLSGREKLVTGQTGPEGIREALAKLNIDQEIELARKQIAGGRKTYRDMAVRKLGYLKTLKAQELSPADWLLDKVPVLPTKFRPVAQIGDKKLPLIADANALYKELIEARDNLRAMRGRVGDLGDERLAVYSAFKAVTGLGEPVHPKLQEKGVRGILKGLLGSSPKFSTVQRQLLGSTVDLVGRATISPEPGYDMDTVGLPEETAWDLYRLFVVRRLKRRGMNLQDAIRHVKDRTSTARAELLSEMDARPVVTSRDPVLHKFGVIALRPKLVKSKTLKLSPLVYKGLGADNDGDAMNFQVPVSPEAVDEAYDKLLPSRNLINPQDFRSPVYQPSQEFLGGLYLASSARSKRSVQTFATTKDAVAAHQRGELRLDDPIRILRP